MRKEERFFVQFRDVCLQPDEAAAAREAVLTFVAQNPVTNERGFRLTGMDMFAPMVGFAQSMKLTSEERDTLFAEVATFMRACPPLAKRDGAPSPAPLFFGPWSGSSLLRIVKPFFLHPLS